MRHPELLPLSAERPGTHLSVYLPASTDANTPPSDRIIHLLRHGHAANEWSGWLDPAAAEGELARHREAVNGTGCGGVAVFLADGFAKPFALAGPVRERVVGGSCFFLKPLVAAMAGEHPFHLLALSRRRAQLFRGSAGGLEPVAVADMPAGLDDPALTQQHGKSHSLHTVGSTHGAGVEAAFHGHSDAGSDRKHDLERYVRRVQGAVAAAVHGGAIPLVVAAVEEELGLYRQMNTYPHLLPGGVTGSPDHRSAEELHRAAWPLVVEQARRPEQGELRQYRELRGTGRTADGIEEVLPAAADGLIGTLLVSADVDLWGTYDRANRMLTVHPTRQPGDDELTNLAAGHVLRHGGTVHPVSPADLDGRTVAALRWLPMDRHGKGGPS